MKFEVERKAHIKDPAAAERELARIGRFAGEQEKQDRYYLIRPARKGRIDMKRDPIFRIRVEGDRCWLSAKRRSMRGKTEVNREVEIPSGSPGDMIWFFEEYLGLSPFVRKTKRTKLYIVEGISVEVNLVEGLGYFLEVEVQMDVMDEHEEGEVLARIDEIFKRLGVSESDIEEKYYIQLLMEK